MIEKLNIPPQDSPDRGSKTPEEMINENRVDRVVMAITHTLGGIAKTLNQGRDRENPYPPFVDTPAKQFGHYLNSALFDELLRDPKDKKLAREISQVLSEIYLGIQRAEYESVTKALQQCVDSGSLPSTLVNSGFHNDGGGIEYTAEMERVLQYLADDRNLDNIHLPN